jgi:acyl-CoA hydrolase
MWPVRYVNDPRVIAQESNFVSINATMAVDLIGQCASETLGWHLLLVERRPGRLRPRGDVLGGGQGFVVLHSTAKGGAITKIVPQLPAGDVVTTLKNTVDKVVTEWGVASSAAGRSASARRR